MEDPNNCNYIILVAYIDGGGNAIPNMLILSRKQHLEKYFEGTNLEYNIYLGINDSGYSNDEIRVQWLKYFDKCTQKKRKEAWKILIIDETKSHTNKEIVKVCYSKNILPFQIPPHTLHLLQPLNVVYFQTLKHYHFKVINDVVRDGDYEFSKLEFLAQITTIHLQAFKKNTIRESF